MLAMTCIFEDVSVNATRGDLGWVCTFCNNLTGATKVVVLTDIELASQVALAIAGDETPASDALYEVAESAADFDWASPEFRDVRIFP